MAGIDKKGNIRGAIGQVIFVTDGNRTYVRSKPGKVRQSAATKSASQIFGIVSEKEKLLRAVLVSNLRMPAIQYFAAKHRAQLRKTVDNVYGDNSTGKLQFVSPAALTGFDLNHNLPWNSTTNFFIEAETDIDGNLKIRIPELRFGKEIKAPVGAKSAKIVFIALSVDLNTFTPEISTLSRLEFSLDRSASSNEQMWTINKPKSDEWFLVAAGLSYDRPQKKPVENFSGCYLFVE